jgi:hypothetical protein
MKVSGQFHVPEALLLVPIDWEAVRQRVDLDAVENSTRNRTRVIQPIACLLT